MTHDLERAPVARVFIGYDRREEVAVNVLTASFQAHASIPMQIGQVRLDQLRGVYTRERDPKQSTDFSFSRFLVPWLAGYQGWALFIDADMLCLGDIAELWALRDESMAVQVVKHQHECEEGLKFQGMPQTPYGRKNWSSVVLFNCERCKALTPEFVNTATGLELHQFRWLADGEIGELPPEWNVLVGVQPIPAAAKVLHYTLGGPWFDDCLDMPESQRWLEAREAMNSPLAAPPSPFTSHASAPDPLVSNRNG
ncbi:glycosyltransferase family 8 protein [Synechococcus sp. J7-Johnson]|uniref:glycosyltransferase n=1 Tax=Synechococcus sp. J7-Johnson TaxID=2823737 RepID=UPI0020CEAA10|nr:glycosyltransferase [Synechococcus sp. J7-Johnson]MCP9841116.1 glycosyltransferase family 8 protein [Synechococcus sp. J7-Johnson]